MSKRKSRRRTERPLPQGRRRARLVASLLVSLLLAGVAAARMGSLWSPKPSPQAGDQVATQSLATNSPSKEYVYAGGKLVATEEPAQNCTYTLSPTSGSYPATASSGSFAVTTQGGCNWTATATNSFITITSGTGTGNGTVTFSLAANNGAARTGTIMVQAQTFTVNQAGTGTDDAVVNWVAASPAMNAGQSYSVSLNLTNTGTTTWTPGSYSLGSQNPQDNTVWGLNQVVVPSTVAPGAAVTFTFTVTAPSPTGSYNFQWRMKHGTSYFGQMSTNLPVRVRSGSIRATPNPIQVCNGSGAGSTTIYWSSVWTTQVEVHLNTCDGPLFGQTGAGGEFSWATGNWVYDGMVFYLQDATDNQPNDPANTLATTTVHLTTAGCTGPTGTIVADPNPISTCSGAGRTQITWATTNTSSVRVRIGNPDSGAEFGSTISGSWWTGDWVTEGTVFYLVDTTNSPAVILSQVTVHLSCGGQPAAPTNLTASAVSGSQVNLLWTDNSSNEDSFTLERKTGAAGTYQVITSPSANVISYSDNTLSPSTTYYYRIKAHSNSSGDSGYSNEASATTQASGSGSCPQASTFSGDGNSGYVEGTGTAAEWKQPQAAVIAIDPVSQKHALFVADTDGQRIRMIYLEGTNAGQSILLAGSGVAGFQDNTDPYLARFRYPRGIAAVTDVNGVVTMLLVADTDNHVIRKLLPPTSTKWRLSAFSGIGGIGYTDGNSSQSQYNTPQGIVVASDGSIYVADTGNGVIRKIGQDGTSTTLVGAGTITMPVGITVSQASGMLYVSDQATQKIWRVDTSGTATALAGSGSTGYADGTGTAAIFNYPTHLAWANTASGEAVYVADRDNQRLRRLLVASGTVSTYAGSGTAGFADGSCTAAQFNGLRGVAVGPSGEVYVVDTANNRIRKVQ
ncbi:MAG TPA: NBR1-Ig-like domain-containing protein [Blastocatellia bacterium]|nr:NBR1-Ig-like domain-containing protein [Blastocatellia bacterium]